ncbi:plexin-B-like isoform X2 [Tachypleus tridentatus]|uniref:plexin-B-like isoform X2 n=1 Tax=Tachypleus tridentatus TaxID=6853 RepID=UPI003FCEF1A6
MRPKKWKWGVLNNVGLMCLLVLNSWFTVLALEESNIYASYTTFNKSVNFTHVRVDPRSGRVYVGATNRLYQFNSFLVMEAELETGPVMDNIDCPPIDCTNLRKMATTNFNKVLVIDNKTRMLIVCGSVHQGACRRHHLTNISNFEDLVPIPIAANDANSSTYAFIGPAGYLDHISRVLYVATTNSFLGTYRDIIPAITSRSLDEDAGRIFGIIEKSFSTIARVDISFHLRDYYLVNYIYGFFSENFVYFATVQRKSHLRALEECGYVTRLARICISDASYNTYTELTLQCIGKDGIDYNLLQDASVVAAEANLAETLQIPRGSDVLVGIFAQSVTDHTSRPARRSAMCIFSLEAIDKRFIENIRMCYNGSVTTRNMDYIAGSIKDCPKPGKRDKVLDFCREALKINGSVLLARTAVIVNANATYSAITTTVIARHTVAFVGTSDGHLKKVLLSSNETAEEFEEVVVDAGNPIIADIHLDTSRRFIYVASPYTVTKVVIQRCQQYNTCEGCLQARNPYCGWCSLQRRCTVEIECQNATITLERSTRWLSLDTEKCIDVQSVKPEEIPIDAMIEVSLTINQLPRLPNDANYMCVFGNSTPIIAYTIALGLSCETPDLIERPLIPVDHDHVTVDLAVRSSETDTDFLHRPFTFYNCSAHRVCSKCVSSFRECKWCLYQHICVHNTSSCMGAIVIGETQDNNFTKLQDHQQCPMLDVKEDILISDGENCRIEINIKHFPTSMQDLQCVIEIEDMRDVVEAEVINSKVVCSKTLYTYKTKLGEMKANLAVMWHGKDLIDETTVTIYKCNLLANHDNESDCYLCLTRDPKYKCVWCMDSCRFHSNCPSDNMTKTCPPPRIDQIYPVSGPVQGGTLVTIKGSNLGKSREDIQDKITIGGIPCHLVEYDVSVRIVCRTGASNAIDAEVIVGNNMGLTRANERFSYKIISLTSMHPNIGPQSGGTHLYLKGSNLNIGSSMEIFLDSIPCKVERTLVDGSQVSCYTTRAPSAWYNVTQLIFQVDNATLTLPYPFHYTKDPRILRINPLKSFVSGGRNISVDGEVLSSIQQPWMIVFKENVVLNKTLCTVHSYSQLVCPSPAINSEVEGILDSQGNKSMKFTDKLKYRIGFKMDDVKSVLKLQENFPTLHSDIVYVADPELSSFQDDGVKQYKGESLVIEGKNLILAATEAEVRVTVGTQLCNLTSLAMTQLVCLPPQDQPPISSEQTDTDFPLVVVHIGSNLRYDIGYLHYEVTKSYEFPTEAIWGITAGGMLLVVISVIMLFLLRRKHSQAEQEYKRIQLQMDTLENSVRSECKQAFAELQTNISDISNDLQASGIPVLDHRTFVMKVFFPGTCDHPVLEEKVTSNGFISNRGEAMTHFQQLLYDKTFLVLFINTLESQRTFNIKQSVLKTLLKRLVEKSVTTKYPQLMLRRTESVVEKLLTNWMALNMYSYLKEWASKNLFLLFCAVKHQVEKGPVDAVTNDARYSLSEQRLLQDHIEYSTVTIHLLKDNCDENVQINVNDCDTINQVKAKILDALYKNIPFSLRPSIYDVDLEWKYECGGHLTLADEDLTTKTCGTWRRINTLRHYGVKDFAVMNLVTKEKSFSSSSIENASISSITPVIKTAGVEQGIKYWHLVKIIDDHMDQKNDHCYLAIRPEVFLTRLLSTKGTVQKFIDDFLSTVLTICDDFPPAVKWLFDLLDTTAVQHGITDPEVVHAWKSNCLTLRFWVNFIKNPDFILDINKTSLLDSCFSVIAQALMDACSTYEHRLGKDSPSNKLLFAKDIISYKKMVTKFYEEVALLPHIPEQEVIASMQKLSLAHYEEFNGMNAVKELYSYAERNFKEVSEALRSNPQCDMSNLVQTFETVMCTLQGKEDPTC